MDEPSLRTSRLAIAGGLLAAAALTGAGFLLGRTTSPRPEPVSISPAPQPLATSTAEPEPPGVLTRADIIAWSQRAADASASGSSLPADSTGLDGRRFDLVIPFGCDGPSPAKDTDPIRWRYDADTQTLRIHVAAMLWQPAPWETAEASEAAGLRGFWVDRPWTSSDRCKPAAAGDATVTHGEIPPEHTLAVVEVLTDEQRRIDRPYAIVKRVAPESIDSTQGFRLRLLGRVDRLPDGQNILCHQPGGAKQRPICLIGVMLDEVRIEQPNGEVMGKWTIRPQSTSL